MFGAQREGQQTSSWMLGRVQKGRVRASCLYQIKPKCSACSFKEQAVPLLTQLQTPESPILTALAKPSSKLALP